MRHKKLKNYLRISINFLTVALVALLGACTPSATTSTSTNALPAPVEFEIHGGVEDYFDELDTLIVVDFKFQDATDEQNVPFELIGPVGWNEGEPHTTILEKTLPNDDRWWLNLDAPIVVGTYKATVQVDGKSYTSSVDIDVTRRLPLAVISVSSASADRVDASWTPVPGAKQYYVKLYDEDTDLYTFYTEETGISFTDFEEPLDMTKQYYLGVEAFSEQLYDFSGDATKLPTLPANVNASFTAVPINFSINPNTSIAATLK